MRAAQSAYLRYGVTRQGMRLLVSGGAIGERDHLRAVIRQARLLSLQKEIRLAESAILAQVVPDDAEVAAQLSFDRSEFVRAERIRAEAERDLVRFYLRRCWARLRGRAS